VSFIGEWHTWRYRSDDPTNPEEIEIRITPDSDPNSLDGTYPRPGPDARLFGGVVGGSVWQPTIDETGSTGMTGLAVFVLSPDGNRLHGAYTVNQHGGGPQPWWRE
jgi:hypothetical protein